MANYNAALTEQKSADNKNCQARKFYHKKKNNVIWDCNDQSNKLEIINILSR